MEGILLFYYTLAILLISVMTSALCLSAFLVSRRRLFVFAASTFFFYFLDVAIVFQDDYLLRGLTAGTHSSVYFLGSQLPSIFTGAGVLTSFWFMVCDSYDEKRKSVLWTPCALFVLSSIAIYAAMYGTGPGLFAFYSMRAVYFAVILAYIAFRYLVKADSTMRERLWRYRFPYAGLWVLLGLVVAENAFFILVIDPALVAAGEVPFFPERNFAENALMVFGAVWMCVQCSKLLSLHFKTPPAQNNQKAAAYIDHGLAAYQDRYGLSCRECEILREVLLGKDNQRIATDMSLALSTVKVHVHNILHKTGQPNRQELMRDFRMHS